jgi:hypothetical protein
MTIPRSKQPIARRRRALPLRRGYSLAAVFLLIATIAVLLAMARSAFSLKAVPEEVLGANLLVGFLGGALIGGSIGIQYQRRVRSTVCGILTGGLAGLVAGVITVADFSVSAALIDCGLLIALAIVVRLMTSGRPKPSATVFEDSGVALLPLRQAHPVKLLASLGMLLCAGLAIQRMFSRLSADFSRTSEWAQALSLLAVALCSFGTAVYLFWAALRRPVEKAAEKRTSPWD